MVTLADIFRQYGPAYEAAFGDQLLPSHRQAIRAIVQCRTPALGGHVYHCDACEQSQYYYHSCRNRHCPQCQGDKAADWLARQQEMLLPTPYFMLTFTLPAELRPLARSRQRLFYNLLFRASAEATQQLAQNPRWLGGDIGMVGILHTWSRDLAYHPHVHYLVPAGAWDGQVWCRPRCQRFLLPVKALSPLFRAKVRDALRQTGLWDQIPSAVWRKPWVVHCKRVGSGRRALQYLAPYVFRVAITNRRLVSLDDDPAGGLPTVTFRYRPSGSRHWRLCTVPVLEFIRRFLQHVLPRGFVKVRYYGFFSSGQRAQLRQVAAWLKPPAAPSKEQSHQAATPEPEPTDTGRRCPLCGQPLRLVQRLPRSQPVTGSPWQPP
ncbi:MAG TPA: IS91 family transposase [Anaerolineales bacterium]